MSRRIANRITALVRRGRPRIRVGAIDGYHADKRAFTVRSVGHTAITEDTGEGYKDGQS